MTAPEVEHLRWRIRVLPSGLEFGARADQTVFAAAQEQGIDWPTRCFGKASCRTCFLFADADERALAEPGRLEAEALKRVAVQPRSGQRVRLACQARVRGDVVVERAGVHPSRSRL